MPLDYMILIEVGVIVIGGALFLLREAKKYRARRHAGAEELALSIEAGRLRSVQEACQHDWQSVDQTFHHPHP